MSFKILYIEDIDTDRERLEAAIHLKAKKTGERPMFLRSIKSPEFLSSELDEQYDVVLADVMFPDAEGEDQDCLSEIIQTVKDWSVKNRVGRSVPIIAYTSAGRQILSKCLDRRSDLFDIWDKSTASADYVTWRFEQLSIELSRSRPDSLLQRLIRTMPDGVGARWHSHVVTMVESYSSGWTEADQVSRVGVSIRLIGAELNASDNTEIWWKIMRDWDPLSRAISKRSRGHSRHVINVFWLGYYILHQPVLLKFFSDRWQQLLNERSSMGAARNVSALEAFSAAWFYAGLFHDIGGCGQKFHDAYKKIREIAGSMKVLSDFPDVVPLEEGSPINILKTRLTQGALELANKLFLNLAEPTSQCLQKHWNTSLQVGKPDHGVLAALDIVDRTKDKEQLCFAREAARAMIVHNLVSDIKGAPSLGVNWNDEPIVCLLLLCDQLQTWDRERGDDELEDDPTPTQAELLYFEVEQAEEKPVLKIGIHYIGDRILTESNEIFERAFNRLETVLQNYPLRSINRIEGSWPFELRVNFWLNRRPLKAHISKR